MSLTDDQYGRIRRLFDGNGMRPGTRRRHVEAVVAGEPSTVAAFEVACPECSQHGEEPCVEMHWDGQVPIFGGPRLVPRPEYPLGRMHDRREVFARMVREDWYPGKREPSVDGSIAEIGE